MKDTNSNHRLSKLLRIIDLTSEWAGKISSFLIYFIIGVMMWSVFMRYFFHMANRYEMLASMKFLPIYVALGGAYTLLHRAHVNTDIIYGRLSLRARSIADLITAVFFFTFMVMILWFAVPNAIQTVERLQFSIASFSPINWPELLLVAIGMLLLFLQGLAKFVRDIMTAITGKKIT